MQLSNHEKDTYIYKSAKMHTVSLKYFEEHCLAMKIIVCQIVQTTVVSYEMVPSMNRGAL